MRGKKPADTNVVPMTADFADAEREARFDVQGAEIAASLKPLFEDPDANAVWDRLAPSLANPLAGRLKKTTAAAFALLCKELALFERLEVEIGYAPGDGFYIAKTRNGLQQKAVPQWAQKNQAFAHVLTLMRDFGMTPAAERGIKNAVQADMFGDDDFS